MKVAVICDWLAGPGGGERVLAEMLALYPQADLFALADFLDDWPPTAGRRMTTSFIHRIPLARRVYRYALPLMPVAVEAWNLERYDLVLSSSHAVAHGVLTGPGQVHVAYVHTPLRHAWDLRGEPPVPAGAAVPWLLHRFRLWDHAAGARPDRVIANSAFVAARIRKFWRREAVVLPPPVEVERFTPGSADGDFYLTAARLVPHKRIDLMLKAFAAMPHRRLTVVGDGPDFRRLAAAAPANVTLTGRLSDAALAELMGRCRAYISAAVEDFGIAPLEAQAAGRPVIALARGGTAETLVDLDRSEPTAVLFPEQTPESLIAAVGRFEAEGGRITVAACRANAERFEPRRFRAGLIAEVEAALAEIGRVRP